MMLKKQEEILDTIEKLIESCEELIKKTYKEISEKVEEIDLLGQIEAIEEYYRNSGFSQKNTSANAEILSVKASAIRVLELAERCDERVIKKLEFELLPLTENLRRSFYYYNWVTKNKESERYYFEKEFSKYYKNRYLERARISGEYKYDLSIIIIAYNKLEYTQKCVESLKKYLPINISYELIFVNHGSSDGTKEYFESQKSDKQLDIEVNGGGIWAAYSIIEGKYRLSISNDVLVTENAINNMYCCITSDDKIGWLVPATPNVSNLQTISASYQTIDEMYEFASKNNISNASRWEEKPRLCNPIDMMKTEVWFDLIGKIIPTLWGISFPDDKISALLRKAGYKLILAKDAYCYHFGSVTIKNQMENQLKARINYCKGRIDFIKEYGLDPWGYGMSYDINLIQNINIKKISTANILGINSGMGGNPLKIKNLLMEQIKCSDINVTYITQYNMNWEDIKGLGNYAYKLKDWTEYASVLDKEYDFILLENGIDLTNIYKIIGLRSYLSSQGRLLVRVEDKNIKDLISATCGVCEVILGSSGYWIQIT